MRIKSKHSPKMQLNKQFICRRDRGVALITAVLVAALVTAAAVAMATTHRFSVQRGFNQLNGTMLEYGVKALESDVVHTLVTDSSLNAVDSLDEQWASMEWIGDQSNVATTARVTDMQGTFNLQNLAAQFGARAFQNRFNTARAATSAVSKAPQDQSISSEQFSADSNFLDSGSQAANLPSETQQAEIEQFDFSEHQQFIDNYVNSCSGENQKCTREAMALVFQQVQAANDVADDTTGSALDANVDSGVTQTTPNGPSEEATAGAGPDSATESAIDSEAQLSALFRALDLDPQPVQAILDWIDQDSETRYPNGAEDEYYTGLEVPYRAGNGPFVTLRELLLVRGVTIDVYNKLAPHLSILPQATSINVNTAGADVLMAIHPMIDRSTAELLIDARKVQAFQTVKAFVEHPALLGLSIPTGLLSTRSEYFLIRSTASTAGLQTHHQAVVKRTNLNTSAVRRSRGYFN